MFLGLQCVDGPIRCEGSDGVEFCEPCIGLDAATLCLQEDLCYAKYVTTVDHPPLSIHTLCRGQGALSKKRHQASTSSPGIPKADVSLRTTTLQLYQRKPQARPAQSTNRSLWVTVMSFKNGLAGSKIDNLHRNNKNVRQ
jgi:hypothetical protein